MLMNVIKMIEAKSRTLCEGTDRGVAMDPWLTGESVNTRPFPK